MGVIVDTLNGSDMKALTCFILLLLVICHVVPYVYDARKLRTYPGPLVAKFSDAWLGLVAALGHRSEVIHALHQKYGTFLRIAPNHLSIAHPDAIQVIYAHGNALKSNFYDSFVAIRPGVFTTRDRADHAHKRKIISHIFSQRRVLEFEPQVRLHVGALIKQWDRLCELASDGHCGTEGESGWHGKNGQLWLDCLPWCSYLAFDIIGDFVFGSPFGMIQAAKDSAAIIVADQDVVKTYGNLTMHKATDIPVIKLSNDTGDFSARMGVLPLWLRAIIRNIVWVREGDQAAKNFVNMIEVMLAKRLSTPTDRINLWIKLEQGKDAEGKPMDKDDFIAEALSDILAGSGTISASSCAITYYLARNPHVQVKLQEELDEHLATEDEPVPTLERLKRLTYLEAVINEGLRLHSTLSLGLPRVVPEGGLVFLDRYFPEGTILSVPTYTTHRDTKIWGEDGDEFRPERWFEQDDLAIQKAFSPFSYGPRVCIGRNLANLELKIIIPAIFRRYQLSLQEEDKPLEIHEGLLRKPVACRVRIRRRDL